MIPSQDAIERLAGRIEQAYCRKNPQWTPVSLTPGVWSTAALRLLEALDEDIDTPVDPEMFVAVQKNGGLGLDPWVELTQERSLQNYRKAIRRIVGLLRRELRAEIRLGERMARKGESLEQILASLETPISALSRFILAHRAGRQDLSWSFRPAVASQDRSCPLYRLASRTLLPAHLYPTMATPRSGIAESGRKAAFSLN